MSPNVKKTHYLVDGGALSAVTTEHNRVTITIHGRLKRVSCRIVGPGPGQAIASAAIVKPISGSTSVEMIATRDGKTLGGQNDYADWEFDNEVYPGWKIQVSMWGPIAGTWRIMAEMEEF